MFLRHFGCSATVHRLKALKETCPDRTAYHAVGLPEGHPHQVLLRFPDPVATVMELARARVSRVTRESYAAPGSRRRTTRGKDQSRRLPNTMVSEGPFDGLE